jgi:hypothetical protein
MEEKNVSNSIVTRSFIEAINQSYSHLFRTVIFFVLIFSFLLVALVIFFKSISETGELKAEFNKDGRLLFELKKSNLFSQDEKKSFASFLLPSNVVWFDTGLELDPDQQCNFKVTGSIHLAIHTVVKSADNDEKNAIPWTNAKGNKFVNIGDQNLQLKAKKQLLLKPGETIGNVLGYYIPVEETKQFKEYFVQHRDELTTKIFEVNEEKFIQNDTKTKVRIYLSVNDILLNFDSASIKTSELAYLGNDKKWLNKWLQISGSNYDNLYFDDNIGNFLVQVEIKGKK